MPYLNGQKVTNAEWAAARNPGKPLDWKAVSGWQDGDPAVDNEEEPTPAPAKKTARAKKAETAAALAAITGLDIDLDDDLTDTSGVEE